MRTISKAKPFIKWVGGKGQLIEQLDAQLPENFETWDNVTYIEPFVGGGAMLFYMLQKYPNIRHAVINDVNPDLITCYRTVRDMPEELIASLTDIRQVYMNSVLRLLQTSTKKRICFRITRRLLRSSTRLPTRR